MLTDFAPRQTIDILLLQEATTEHVYNIVGYTTHLSISDIVQGTAILAEEGIGITRITSLTSDRGLRQPTQVSALSTCTYQAGPLKGRQRKISLVWACHTHSDLFRPTWLWVGISIFLCPPRIARNFSGALDRVVRRLSFIDVWKNLAERKVFTYYAPQSPVGIEGIYVPANLI